MSTQSKHVAVLKGGWSAEREVSLVSGRDCAEALREAGYRVSEVDVARDLASVLDGLNPDVVFNALHGQWGEDGCVQGLLEVMGLPYTHSGVLASSLAMDKEKAKLHFRSVGIRCAKSIITDQATAASSLLMEPPYVIKPVAQGSSVGVFMVRVGDNRPPEALSDPKWDLGDYLMVEEFIDGRELTVAVMGDRALAVTEIDAHSSFYDYEAKYADGGSTHVIPAKIPDDVYAMALEQAKLAHDVLGCRGVTRTDFRYNDTPDGNGALVILETNTQPGMTPTSLVPEQAAHLGISFPELVSWIVEDASCLR
ncbi:MAG: D-alanine--D-alanine ligase [Alphaproteobacteria bacterium]|nr:MAG: D-alanine--D-alanine ligase [Alphaproteobacteria bacterium]